MKILLFIGARPNVPKAWTVYRSLNQLIDEKHPDITVRVIHSGQHYDRFMGEDFANMLKIDIDRNLKIGSCSSDGKQIASLIIKIECLLQEEKPNCVIVLGDVNTTLAASLVSSRLGIPIVHVEAGLRSFAREPEETNRKIITSCANYHFVYSDWARDNLIKENIPPEKIWLVGNTMAETFLYFARERNESKILDELCLKPKEYFLFSLHKTENLAQFDKVAELIMKITNNNRKLVFIYHPHTIKKIKKSTIFKNLVDHENIQLVSSLNYFDAGQLLENSIYIITDSAGFQEETSVIGIPCFTIGNHTARPDTINFGTNELIGFNIAQVENLLNRGLKSKKDMPYWDEQVSVRLGVAFHDIFQEIAEQNGQIKKLRF